MYNLLLILLMLKGEHVDRDLTYEGLARFDVMNTKLNPFICNWQMIAVQSGTDMYYKSHRKNVTLNDMRENLS